MASGIKIFFSLSLFIIFITVGIIIASRKPLWNDEIHTYVHSIRESSYQQIIFAGMRQEDNKSPLFYLQQKIFCDIFHYDDPDARDSVFERIFLRIPTVLEFSLFLSMLFYFFTRRFNFWFGLLSIFVALSTIMIWRYWAEARPYGLWVLLTGCQMLLLIDIIENVVVPRGEWVLLGLVHILLALTCILSVIQIAIVSTILLFKNRDLKKFLFLLLIPVGIGLCYKPIVPYNDVIFTMTVGQVLHDNIARDRLCILLFYPLLLLLDVISTKFQRKIFKDHLIVRSSPFFLAVFSMILVTVVSLSYLRGHALNQGQYVVSRHIIFLLPVGIIAVTYLAGIVWESLKTINWMRILLMAGIFILLSYRMGKIVAGIKGFFLALHA